METSTVPDEWSKCTISNVEHDDGIAITLYLSSSGMQTQYIQALNRININQVPVNTDQKALANQRLEEIISCLHDQTSVVFE